MGVDKVNIKSLSDILRLENHKNIMVSPSTPIKLSDVLEFSKANPDIPIDKVGFEIKKGDLKIFDDFCDCLEIENLQPETGRQILNETLEEAYSGRMSFLSKEKQEAERSSLNQSIKKGKAFVFTQNKRRVGFILIRDFEREGEVKTLVSWIWSAPDNPPEIKKAFKAEVSEILRSSQKEKIISAVHLHNLRSLNFFSNLGFYMTWIYICR